jgi:hypothetical protein
MPAVPNVQAPVQTVNAANAHDGSSDFTHCFVHSSIEGGS